MSASDAQPGITDVPQPVYPPLPAVTDDLYVIHYTAAPRADGYAPTTPVAAIVLRHVLRGTQVTFAALTEAEAAGISPAEYAARLPVLEAEVLRTFADYATSRPRAVWLHWRMRDVLFGFDALTQRARVHQTRGHGIPPERRYDLANHLSRRYGDEYAPRPRLLSAVRRNLGEVPGLLGREGEAAAWARGDHAAVLAAVAANVDAIARLFDRARADRFISGEGGPYQGPADAGPDPARHDAAALIRPGRPSSPGPPVRLHPELFEPARLTERHRTILAELFRMRAFDRASSVITREIAVAVDGPNGNENSFKRPVADLGRWECVDSATGNGGGIWLTAAGRAIAEG